MKSIIIYLILVLFFASNVYTKETIRIASSPPNISYYKVVKSIEEIANENKIEITVIPNQTKGSVENINQLLNHEADFAIVQNDISFFAQEGLPPFTKKTDKLRIVLPLFKEPIFLLTTIQGIHYIREVKNKKIVLGVSDGGLTESAKVILKSAGIWDSITKYNYQEDIALEKLKSTKVDVIFVNNLTADMKKSIVDEKLFIIPISDNLIKKLQKTFPYFSTYKYSINNTESISTIAVHSILITSDKMDDETVYTMINLLVNNFNSLIFPDKYHTPLNELFKIDTSLEWHDGVKLFFEENDIIPSSAVLLDKYFWYIMTSIVLLIILLILFLSIVFYKMGLLYILNDKSKFLILLRKIYLNAIKYKYVLIIFFMIVSYAVSILVIKYFEHQWALEHNVTSIFDENPFLESLLWFFIFSSTGYSGNFFPSSAEGKLIVSLIPMVGVGGFIALVGLITSDQIKKYFLENKGMANIKFKNHIIICGWNTQTELLIDNLTHKNLSNKRPIVILADNIDFNPIEKYNLDNEYVKYVSGIATDREALRRANLKDANTAIIVSDLSSSDPDARTILNVLTIEKFCTELIASHERVNQGQIYTIAEIVDKKNEQTAKDASVNQVITLGDIESKIFSQSVQNPGVVKFINEIFTYNDFNDIYSLFIDSECNLLGKTYDEILSILRKQNILLLSISVESKRSEKEINIILEKFNLSRSVITNPIKIEEQEYQIQEEDTLIVLARYEEDLVSAKKSIR